MFALSFLAPKPWPDYRAVWRWHFYASLFSIPFVLILSVSGAIYLFKLQIEAFSERAYDRLQIQGMPATAAAQVQSALAAVPDSTVSGYELPKSPDSAARVIVRQRGEAIRVYLHPETLQVLHTFPENDRFMRVLFRLHGELWMGDRGSNLVELAASWTIIMIVTGLFLWWPRQTSGWGGIIYPRMVSGSRIFWRDLHSVPGFWISAFALFLLFTGLPWAKFWGNYFKTVRRMTGTAVAQQDWSTGSERHAASKQRSDSGEHGGHGGSSRSRGGGESAPINDFADFDRVAAVVRPLKLAQPVVIAPPARAGADWTAKSMTSNRPLRVNLTINPATGQIVSRDGFRDRHLFDQLVAIGIAAHEGQLFGWPNQLLGLTTALGLILLCVSGVVMWWRRRDPGTLGAPKVLASPRFSLGLIVLVVLFGLYLPLFGASLVAVLLVEKLILCRIPPVRDWLGLRAAGTAACLLLAVLLIGCGPRPVTGGTKGVLRGGGSSWSEIQLTIHSQESGSWQPVGFAVTQADGNFELVTNGAQSALWLEPGEYRCTLESAGAPVLIPKEYSRAETTPLAVSWSASSDTLDLEAPLRLVP